ncbi:MAG: FAD-binding oxidoreductase [Proteobacteria bacterium]|nr:FAD-binding oxidoreductase [Pseudomonadota bacterium]
MVVRRTDVCGERDGFVSATDFDIVVIGAGIAGASAAALLAQTRRVLVLERESQPGYHSTGRSAALFSAIYGSPGVRALSRASRDFLYAPAPGFAEAPLVKPRGALYIASRDQVPALDVFSALPDIAPATRAVDTAEALRLCPILREDYAVRAVLEPDAADVDVHSLHQGYLRMLRARGGVVATDREVERLERRGGRWRVTANGETYSAPIVINAAGAWADVIAGLAGVAPVGLQPMRRTAVLVDPPEGVSVEAWPMVIDIDEQFYFKPDAGQLLLSPADETPVDPCDAQADEWDVATAVARVEEATTLQVRRVAHRWAGLRSFVADRTPVVGYAPDAEGFFWLAGQGGYGIQTGPAMAETACALVLGREIPARLAALGVDARDLAPERLLGEPETAQRVTGAAS